MDMQTEIVEFEVEAAAAPGPATPPGARPIWLRAILAGALGQVLVGSSVGVSKALTAAPLFTAQAIRYAFAALILLALARKARATLVRPRGVEWLYLGGIAAFGLVLFNVAVVRGVAHAEPAVIAVAVASVPVLLGVIGPMLEHRAPSRHVLLAAVTVTAGAALVEGTGHSDATGLAWAAVALVCEAAFTLLAVPVLKRHGAWGVSLHAVWIGALMLAVLGLVAEGPTAAGRLSAADWAAMAYLALLVTVVAFLLWFSTVATLGSGPVGLLTGVAPISAALVGIALGGRAPGLSVWAGIAVVLTGLALGLRRR
jgi:drug/metabolite transporter (DMT)-like permease